MKKILSLLLIAALLITALAAFPTAASAEVVFQEGDVLYLRVESPAEWADNAILYANFTAASRADNGDRSIMIASADAAKYHPVTGIIYDESRGLYRYTVTAADAGASVMRFWRGNEEKLWNCSVSLSAADYAAGKNTAVVTDWTDAGRLDTVYLFDLSPKITLDKSTGALGDSFAISVTYVALKSATVTCELYINDTKVADKTEFTFTPETEGAYRISAELTAVHFSTGELMSKASVSATVTVGTAPIYALAPSCLYAHASRGSKDTQAWVKWYGIDGTYYFFLPSSVKKGEPVELYSSYDQISTLDSMIVPANGIVGFTPDPDVAYIFRYSRTTRTVRFMYSSAESALFINNIDDFNGDDFFSYLQQNKENSVAALGAYTHTDGSVTEAQIKKMKGRGNTSWNADKKGFNVTFQDAITLDGMEKCKKFSLISNFQDAAMLRNRILYDLSDAVGIPYASDSRMIDLYTNGKYQGTYQMCQKVDVGKNTLMPDISDTDYLDKATGGVKPDFAFVAEIDSSPADDDFHFTVQNGSNLTMKSPELEAGDPNIAAVRGYIKNKFNAMWNKLSSGADDLDDYIDVESLAKVYLINELGKNWDSGATSFFLTYKPDAQGNYKFFASPVWDYDNSLGNARGLDYDLWSMGVTDYTLPTGWFATKKNGYTGPNFLATAAKHTAVMDKVYQVWFEAFVPALDTLTKTGVDSGELYSADVYYAVTKGSAEMNYKIWYLDTDSGWIADHSSLLRYSAEYTYNTYGQITGVTVSPFKSKTTYDQYTYDGQFNYMVDWTTSRAAWISGQYISHYHPEIPADPTEPPTQPPTDPPAEPPTDKPIDPIESVRRLLGDADKDGEVTILDATAIQRRLAELDTAAYDETAADADEDGEVTILDATAIQRCLAELPTHEGIGTKQIA